MLGVYYNRLENDDKLMPTDLFSRLFRYRPTHGRVPWEDWFTESFAAVLNRYPKLGAAYAGYLTGCVVETADIETQRTFDNARPDMWVDARDADGGRHVVMVEHKMAAPAEAPQLQAYERRLQKLRWVWVCEIEELRMRGESLSALYLEFFTGAFTALKAVL